MPRPAEKGSPSSHPGPVGPRPAVDATGLAVAAHLDDVNNWRCLRVHWQAGQKAAHDELLRLANQRLVLVPVNLQVWRQDQHLLMLAHSASVLQAGPRTPSHLRRVIDSRHGVPRGLELDAGNDMKKVNFVPVPIQKL